MKIFTLRTEERRFYEEPVEGQLQQFATSGDATSRQLTGRLIELVRFLESEGPPSARIHASVFNFRPLILVLFKPKESTLKTLPRDPRLIKPGTSIQIQADYYDSSPPTDDGCPVLHYRLEISREGSNRTLEIRTDDQSIVLQRILATFGLKHE